MPNPFLESMHLQILLLIVVLASVFSALTPPFQSPDELAHIQRAYLLTHGQIFLEGRPEQGAGGEVDTGLLAYFGGVAKLPFHPERKMSKQEEMAAASIKWTGQRTFVPAPGTGYYFPLAYAPQALALGIGKALDLTVRNSYYLARFFVLAASVSVLAAAFALFPANPFILGLLITPMSIFQFASASLDAFTFALTVLCMALFMRGSLKEYRFPGWMTYALAACVFLLTTSRTHLMPLLLLPLWVWFVRRKTVLLWQFVVVSVLSVVWTVAAMKASYVSRAAESSTSDVIAFYITHPKMMIGAFWNTVSDWRYIDSYRRSFIGVLGWLDTALDSYVYDIISLSLFVALFASISTTTLKVDWRPRLILTALFFLSVFIIFFALLVTWNPVPAGEIEGIQGRYFVSPLIILGYVLSGCAGGFTKAWKKVAVFPLLTIAAVVAFSVPKTLSDRYSLAIYDTGDLGFKMVPSVPLDVGSPLALHMTARHQNEGVGLTRIGVMFGTYARQNPGDAELRLKGPDRAEFFHRFSLSDLADNQYHVFDLDEGRYTLGEIVSMTGGGVSTWESHSDGGQVNTCIAYEYSNGAKGFTVGCPVF